jgi:hypothetical protein
MRLGKQNLLACFCILSANKKGSQLMKGSRIEPLLTKQNSLIWLAFSSSKIKLDVTSL